MAVFIDQTGRSISLNDSPGRIVSLVPSQTELLAALGLDSKVAGITKFCVHPVEWFRSKPRIGGTKQVSMEAVYQLRPDLIIANKEENVKEQVEELSKHYPVWISDVNNLEDACEMIAAVGTMTGKSVPARQMIDQIKESFTQLQTSNLSRRSPLDKPRTAYLIWRDPYMAVGGDTFIHSMLEAAGFDNVFQSRKRYPEISIGELNTTGCELLLLSSEPFPFAERHREELQAALPSVRIELVDGEMFSWYGSRLRLAPDYFKELRVRF